MSSAEHVDDSPTMERVTLRLTKANFEAIEDLVDEGRYPNRSEAIRAGVRELLDEEEANER